MHARLVGFALALSFVVAARAPDASAEDELALDYIRIADVKSYLDGGTEVIEGQVFGEKVRVRLDRRGGSPTFGTIFLQRGDGPEVEMEPAELERLQRGISSEVSGRHGLKNVGRAISDKLVEAGLETRRPERFLSSFRVVDVDGRGYPKGGFRMEGRTKNGPRTILLHHGEVLFKPRSFEHYELGARPLHASERADLLRALSKPAIARLPNRTMRAGAARLRAAVAAEHAAAKAKATAKKPRGGRAR